MHRPRVHAVAARLPRAAGPRRVETDAYFLSASPACAVLESAAVERVRAGLVAARPASYDDVARRLSHAAERAVAPAAPRPAGPGPGRQV